uniref:hypothetical protein n=1 Tax=Saccharomonospora halophila TaxID=129922 RepID=UPI0003609549|nr:hypothetical protein [Saccharomonospora halophila]
MVSTGVPVGMTSASDSEGSGARVVTRIGFLLLELGFTIAEEGGIDPAGIEHAVSHAYGLPTD